MESAWGSEPVTGERASSAGPAPEPGEFGSRPRNHKPHSIDLFGLSVNQVGGQRTSGLDLIVGIGVGAALMYYLDPQLGRARREAIRRRIIEASTEPRDGD